MSAADFAPRQRSQLFDLWLLPRGKDPLVATADDLTLVTVAAPDVSAARAHRNVERAMAKGQWILDVVASGTTSVAVVHIQARKREAADAAAQREWSERGRDPAVSAILGSRLLGS